METDCVGMLYIVDVIAEIHITLCQHGIGYDREQVTVVALACRGALVNENGLQVILLTACILRPAAWGLVGPKVYAQWEAEPVSGLDLHQLLHNSTPNLMFTAPMLLAQQHDLNAEVAKMPNHTAVCKHWQLFSQSKAVHCL